MKNDLLGPVALAHVYQELGLNDEVDFTCEELDGAIECQVFDDFEDKLIDLELPVGVRLVKMGYTVNGQKYYEFGIVDFGLMDLQR